MRPIEGQRLGPARLDQVLRAPAESTSAFRLNWAGRPVLLSLVGGGGCPPGSAWRAVLLVHAKGEPGPVPSGRGHVPMKPNPVGSFSLKSTC